MKPDFTDESAVVGAAALTVPYDAPSGEWLFDAEGLVSRNDVLYVEPCRKTTDAMPTGGGDFAAMVRCDGDLDLHLNKSDAWGFVVPAVSPVRWFFNNVSPGHLRLTFGSGGQELAARGFKQRLDLYHGKVIITLGSEEGGPRLEIWGHPTRKLLVVEVIDPQGMLPPPRIELSEWRETMAVGATGELLWAREVHARPARPHLANTGMQDFFDADSDPLLGRGLAVAVTVPGVTPDSCEEADLTATMVLSEELPSRYHLFIAAAVTTAGDPLAAAQQELAEAADVPLDELRAEHQAWWRDYWGRSVLRLESPDRRADWLSAAYHVHLYTLACVNRGPFPAKWDAGPGLMQGDERLGWLGQWVQEIRFTFLPLYAANRLEMAQGLPRFYSAMVPYLEEQTRQVWGLPGLWIPEEVLPWGHAEDVLLQDADAEPQWDSWHPETRPYGYFHKFGRETVFVFTGGLEVCQHYLTYYRYSGDEGFLRDQAYPVLRGVCEFVSSLLRQGEDGRYHLDPANALEAWWMVRDPADALAGVSAIFTQFIRLAEAYGRDTELRARCADRLARLPDPPRGLWREDGVIEPREDVWAPAAAPSALGDFRKGGVENPALYRVFPFSLSGLGAPDYEVAHRTFELRNHPLAYGCSMDAIWAARLGLGEEACALLAEYAARLNRFPYGGWTGPWLPTSRDALYSAPFLDAGGLSAFALNEILLQSHGGIIRALPAVAASWSGIFHLRAEGGFLIAASFSEGQPHFVEVKSLFGRECKIVNPWGTTCVVREEEDVILRSEEEEFTFATQPGHTYIVERADRPLRTYQAVPLADRPNQSPGLPGRD